MSTGNSGGIDNSSGGTMDVSNTTIVENEKEGLITASPGDLTIANSIVANNMEDDCFNTNVVSLGNNIVRDGSCGFAQAGDLSNTDPMIGPLADNGGPTLTHALMSGSPAVDAGNNATCESEGQRGTMRSQDGDDNGVAICDIGALEMLLSELIPQVNPPGTGNGDSGGGCSLAPENSSRTAFPLYLLLPAVILFRRLKRFAMEEE